MDTKIAQKRVNDLAARGERHYRSEGRMMASVEISSIEVLALKELALICGALGQILKDHDAIRAQIALTRVLIDVVNRADAALESRQTKETV